MAQNKEQLNKLLKFIRRLVDEPGNEEFVIGLRKMLDVPVPSSIGNLKLTDIEKYLGLDYRLDSIDSLVDYSFVRNEYIRNQLIADFREMLRYRYGVRSHKIDFSEFCRYSMLQVEQLLNYFYQNNFATIDEIKNYIKENVSWAVVDNVESVKSVPLAIKLTAFLNNKSRKQRDTLDFAREVRNAQSHRSDNKYTNNIAEFKAMLTNLGFPLTKEGEVYWNGIKDNEQLVSRYKEIDKSEYWNYRFQLWYNREPFDELIEAIQETAKQVKGSLTI